MYAFINWYINFLFTGKYVIRFTVTSQYTTIMDITRDWAEIKATATEIINDEKADSTCNKTKVSLAGRNLILKYLTYYITLINTCIK